MYKVHLLRNELLFIQLFFLKVIVVKLLLFQLLFRHIRFFIECLNGLVELSELRNGAFAFSREHGQVSTGMFVEFSNCKNHI